jgi:hypothetical protein
MNDNWTLYESKDIVFGDKRLNERYEKILNAVCKHISLSIPQALANYSDCEAVYRFVNNDKVNYLDLLEEHGVQTLKRMKDLETVHTILAVQDTTSIDLTTKNLADKLGSLEQSTTRGFFYHPTMLVTPDNQVLGMVQNNIWTRDLETIKLTAKDKRERNRQRPIEEKESMRWILSYREINEIAKQYPQKRVVSIGDRESDIFDLLRESTQDNASAKIIIRATHDRKTIEDDEKIKLLWTQLLESDVKVTYSISIPATHKREARESIVEVRCKKVNIIPPQIVKSKKTSPINVVFVSEVNENVPENERLQWMLLTTLPIDTEEQVNEVVMYYKQRWKIEVFFKVLKSVCKVESHHFREPSAYLVCLSIKVVCAWRVLHMGQICLNNPDIDPRVIFSELELRIIKKMSKKKDLVTARDYIHALAKLGGYMNRNRNSNPGYVHISQGLNVISNIKDYEMELQKE